MKHLKSYKIFEDYGIKQEIGELLANLTDDGYHINIIERGVNGYDVLVITIDKRIPSNKGYIPPEDLVPFPWIEVRPEIQRMVAYLNDRYFLNQTKLYKATWNKFGNADREVFSFDFVIPMVGTDNLSLRNVEMTFVKEKVNESREVDISIEREKEIYNIIDDCLLDITDNDSNFRISRALSDDYEIVNNNKALLGMELQVTLYNNKPFELNDIVESLNNLISQLSGEGIELRTITYRYNDIAKTKHDGWYRMSMDPIDNKIKGNTILPSDLDKLKSFKLTFN